MELLIHLTRLSVEWFYTPMVFGVCRNLFKVIFSSMR